MAGFRVGIESGGKKGWIQYDSEKKKATVEHPDANIREAVKRYLSSPREFWIPESDRIDDYRKETKRPTESTTHMTLALSGGFYETGAEVLWNSKENVPSPEGQFE
jgi:hypothetical protein